MSSAVDLHLCSMCSRLHVVTGSGTVMTRGTPGRPTCLQRFSLLLSRRYARCLDSKRSSAYQVSTVHVCDFLTGSGTLMTTAPHSRTPNLVDSPPLPANTYARCTDSAHLEFVSTLLAYYSVCWFPALAGFHPRQAEDDTAAARSRQAKAPVPERVDEGSSAPSDYVGARKYTHT